MYGSNFTKGYQGRGFQPLSSTEAYVLGTNGNLWHAGGPWGQVPPPRNQVDGNVSAFQALSSTEVFVLGTNGNLWYETGPWGTVPPARQQVDGNVAAFQALSSTEVFVLGTNGNLWLLAGGAKAVQIDGNVAAFQALSSIEVYVLGTNGNLWHAGGPWGQVPPPRLQVDGNVAAFQALSSSEAFVLGTNGNLWHETGTWGQVPPPRQQVDGSVLSFYALSGNEAYVEGSNSALWHETGPWGQVPPTRTQVDSNVWPDNNITINSFPNVSGLDGTATLTVYESGAYSFSGGWSPSNVLTGLAAQDVDLVLTLRDSNGTLWVFSTAGTVPVEGSYNFNNTGTNVLLAQNWKFLSAGYTWHDNCSASIDLFATAQEVINWYNQNKQTINQIVQVAGKFAGLAALL